MNDPALLRLTAGRARASELAPYFSSALFAMTPVATPGLGSYAVDPQWRLYWDPAFCLSMTVEEGAAVWLHEVGHLLREHSARFDALLEPDARRTTWNKAADAAVNADLRDAGIALPPVKATLPETIAGAARDMTTEQLYRLIATPAGRTAAPRAAADLVLLPPKLAPDHAPGTTVTIRARQRVEPTVRLLDEAGRVVPDVHSERVDHRSVSLTLGRRLAPGRYTVQLGRLTATLTVVAPQVQLRPDSLARDRAVPSRVVVEGIEVRFDTDTHVELLDADGEPVPGLTGVELLTPELLSFTLGELPDDLYLVRVTAGATVCTAVLPVGLPLLDVEPADLPAGHTTPWTLTVVASDLALTPGAGLELLDLAGGPVPGAFGPLTVTTPTSGEIALLRTLPEGRYAVLARTGDSTAVGPLTVGGTDAEDDEAGTGQSGAGDQTGEGDDGDDCGSGAGGARRPWELGEDTSDGAVSTGRAERIRADVARAVTEHTDALARGSLTGGWLRWAQGVLHPQVDWRQELRAVVRRTAATVAGRRDYSYARPSRRAAASPGVVLPALRAPRPPRCTVVLDTSGSMDDELLGACLTEIDALIARLRGEPVAVIVCDTSAADAQAVRTVRQLDLVGGGGTDLRVGLAAAAARRPQADLVVTLTDGYTPWPVQVPAANRHARYVAVLVGDGGGEVPGWLHTIRVS